jgi:hypothetical protein
MTRKLKKPTQRATYEVSVCRTITYATEAATLRVQATTKHDARRYVENLVDQGLVHFGECEVQDAEPYDYSVEEVPPDHAAELAKAALQIYASDMLSALRDISAETTKLSPDTEVIANIQGICRRIIPKASGLDVKAKP